MFCIESKVTELQHWNIRGCRTLLCSETEFLLQARVLCKQISQAWRKGRVDVVVQSTDKNFMVPVGGSIIAAGPNHAHLIDKINAAYPGRASASPMIDLLVTLLHWGATGWKQVLQVIYFWDSYTLPIAGLLDLPMSHSHIQMVCFICDLWYGRR